MTKLSELRFFCEYLQREGMTPLVQEHVGSPDEEYTVTVTFTNEKKISGTFCLKRESGTLFGRELSRNKSGRRPYTISAGRSQGLAAPYPEAECIAKTIAERIGATASINVQFRREGKKLLVFEMNPRFSGGTGYRALLGYNDVDALVRNYVLGETPPT